MVNVTFDALNNDCNKHLKFVVIASQHKGQWVFVQHKERTSWEMPGGHIELNETADDAARRELNEETGAIEFDLSPICDYNVQFTTDPEEASWGRLYFSNILKFGPLPESEIGEIAISDACPGQWTYELIQPKLQVKLDDWLQNHG